MFDLFADAAWPSLSQLIVWVGFAAAAVYVVGIRLQDTETTNTEPGLWLRAAHAGGVSGAAVAVLTILVWAVTAPDDAVVPLSEVRWILALGAATLLVVTGRPALARLEEAWPGLFSGVINRLPKKLVRVLGLRPPKADLALPTEPAPDAAAGGDPGDQASTE